MPRVEIVQVLAGSLFMTLLNLPLCVADNTGGRQGFNLIELVIVLALIAMLSATAMFFYQQYRARIYRLDAQQSLLALMQQQQNYYSQHQRYQIDMGDRARFKKL